MSGERNTVPVISADWPWRKLGDEPIHLPTPVESRILQAWAVRVLECESLCQEHHALGIESGRSA
jgi:hypothetical protein